MDASSANSTNSNELYRVRDPSGLLWTILGMLPLALLSFYCNSGFMNGLLTFSFDIRSFKDLLFGIFIMLPIFNLPLIVITFRLKAIWKGIELDTENRRMSFPGGGIAANDFADYFKADYLLQYFKRFDINVDEISQIEAEDTTSTHYNKAIKQYVTTTNHSISFVGTFGSASVNFNSSGKRDQIYNAIRQLNKMGTPYVKAN